MDEIQIFKKNFKQKTTNTKLAALTVYYLFSSYSGIYLNCTFLHSRPTYSYIFCKIVRHVQTKCYRFLWSLMSSEK